MATELPTTDDALRCALITAEDQRQTLTEVCTVDAHTALVRGLADYVRSLGHDFNGATYKFETIAEDWPDQEEDALYPSACVSESDQGGEYALEPISPSSEGFEIEHAHVELIVVGGLKLAVRIETITTSREERIGVMKLLEDAANPVRWMGGFRLALPIYHGVHATYDLRALQYQDGPDDTARGYRRVVAVYEASLPVIRAFPMVPPIRLGAASTVDGLD